MSLKASGLSGVVRVGGRVAAELGRWTFEGSSSAWVVEAKLLEDDPYLLEYDAPKELRLDLGTRTWRFRDVVATQGVGDITITGSGRPETM